MMVGEEGKEEEEQQQVHRYTQTWPWQMDAAERHHVPRSA